MEAYFSKLFTFGFKAESFPVISPLHLFRRSTCSDLIERQCFEAAADKYNQGSFDVSSPRLGNCRTSAALRGVECKPGKELFDVPLPARDIGAIKEECVCGEINGGDPSKEEKSTETLIAGRTLTLFRLTTAIRLQIGFSNTTTCLFALLYVGDVQQF